MPNRCFGIGLLCSRWHRIVCFNKLGEIVRDHLHKGNKIYIEGKLRTRKWQDNNNNDRYITEVIGDKIEFFSNQGGNYNNNNDEDISSSNNNDDEIDDDIPF